MYVYVYIHTHTHTHTTFTHIYAEFLKHRNHNGTRII